MQYIDDEIERDIQDAISCDEDAAGEPPAEARENTDDQDMDKRILDLPDKVQNQIRSIMEKSGAKSFGELNIKEKDTVHSKVHRDDD